MFIGRQVDKSKCAQKNQNIDSTPLFTIKALSKSVKIGHNPSVSTSNHWFHGVIFRVFFFNLRYISWFPLKLQSVLPIHFVQEEFIVVEVQPKQGPMRLKVSKLDPTTKEMEP